jgi:hypothetical protein
MQEVSQITDPHVIIAIMCVVGACLIAGALIIWIAIEKEMKSKK